MIMNTLLYGIAFTCNCAILSATIMSPMKEELRLFNPRQGAFEYGMKRSEASEEPDSKERRSNMGSSFIRFGRSHFDGNSENLGYVLGNGDEGKMLRTSRGKPDNIIRFGRSSMKAPHKTDHMFERMGKGDLKFIRYGRNIGMPLEMDLSLICPNLMLEEDPRNNKDLQLYLSKLMYICNNGGNNDVNDESLHRNIDFTDDDNDSV